MKFLNNIYYIIIPLLILGISFNIIAFPIALLALLLLILAANRHTVGIFLLMYGGTLGGVIRAMYPFLPIYGIILEFIGFLLIWDLAAEFFNKHKRAIFSMLFVLAFFGFFYLLGPRDGFANQKYIKMCLHGTMMLFGYFAFDRSKNVDAEKLTLLLLLGSICMYSYVITFLSMSSGGLLDFNWFRKQFKSSSYANGGVDVTVVSYQEIGMMVLYASVIFLSQIKMSKWKTVFCLLCAVDLTLVSGCRQAIVGVLLAIVLRYVLFSDKNVKKKKAGSLFFWFAVSLLVLYFASTFIFSNISSDVMGQTLAEGDTGRQFIILLAWQIFQDSPILGAGLGGFHAMTDWPYPHNFIMELLAETGLVGTIVSFIILAVPLFRKGEGVFRITRSQMYYFLIILGIFVRVVVSSDLTESIELFSAVFAISGSNSVIREC